MSTETPEAAIKRVNIPDERPGRGRASVVEGVTEASEEARGGSEEDDDGQDNGDDAEHDEDGEAGAGGESGGDDEGEEQGEEGAEGESAADPEAVIRDDDPKPAKEPWYTKRIGKLTKEASNAKEELQAARDKIAAMEAASAGGEDAPRLYTQAEVDAQIEKRASEKSEISQINGKLDTMFETGLKSHKDFEKRVQAYGQAFGQELATRVDFFTAVSDLDNGSDVLYALGGDLDRMADILEMSGPRMGIALANLSAKLAAPKPKPLSKAPSPIKPLESTTKAAKSIWDKDISDDEYVRLRREQRAAKQANGR